MDQLTFDPVKVQCGCTLRPDHRKGERLMYCSCGIGWIVSANHAVTIDHDVRPLTIVAPQADG